MRGLGLPPSSTRTSQITLSATSVTDLVRGKQSQITTYTEPQALVYLLASLPAAPTTLPFGTVYLDLSIPPLLLGWGFADVNGHFEQSATVPAFLPTGTPLALQSLVLFSNGTAEASFPAVGAVR